MFRKILLISLMLGAFFNQGSRNLIKFSEASASPDAKGGGGSGATCD